MTSARERREWFALRALAAGHADLALGDLGAGVVKLDEATLAPLAGLTLEASEVRALREDLVRWVRSKNQFFTIDESTENEIETAIVRLVDLLARGELAEAQDVLDDTLDGLASLVRGALGEAPREVVASEYAPEIQLAVLGLVPRELAAPLLDLGCGTDAALVRFARSLGLEAAGIDREAPHDATRADWLTYDYGSARWRTIVSHLAFTLHFLRAHHASEIEARRYAEAFVRITRALVVGGCFAYAPSVPFFEGVLPEGRFRIERHRVHGGATLDSLRQTSGLDLGEATRITRIA